MIFRKEAYDYSYGIIIYDPITMEVFEEEEALKLRAQGRRFCQMGRVQGAPVMTLEELESDVPLEQLREEYYRSVNDVRYTKM